MNISLGCKGDCWNADALTRFAYEQTIKEQAALRRGFEVRAGRIACSGEKLFVGAAGPLCPAHVVDTLTHIPGNEPDLSPADLAPRFVDRKTVPDFRFVEPTEVSESLYQEASDVQE